MFAKPPCRERVKTRLASSIGPDAALWVYQEMLRLLFDRLVQLPDRIHVQVWTSEVENEGALETLVDGRFTMERQIGSGLGERLDDAFRRSFGRSRESVAVIGSDSPDLPLDFVLQAEDALVCSPMTIGPTEDGGYYLVGFAQHVPGVFRDVPWSSGNEYRATLDRADELGVSSYRLPIWKDIDDLDDLRSFIERNLASSAEPGLHQFARRLSEDLAFCLDTATSRDRNGSREVE